MISIFLRRPEFFFFETLRSVQTPNSIGQQRFISTCYMWGIDPEYITWQRKSSILALSIATLPGIPSFLLSLCTNGLFLTRSFFSFLPPPRKNLSQSMNVAPIKPTRVWFHKTTDLREKGEDLSLSGECVHENVNTDRCRYLRMWDI